ncbi:hypothetical protein AAFP94_14340 [Flavobacteriaceae bacterium MJ-SS4]|uniref:hypothetical protein n=1 Tax=Gilvirhabdus luticola TaxID=3079858 RepID=UPI0032DD7475
MKLKPIYLIVLSLLLGLNVQAQLMDKLKERAKEKGIETNEEVTYDKSAYDPNMDTDDEDEYEDLEINSPEEFFDKDVVMALYNEKDQLVQTAYFDKEVIAMRTETVANPLYPIFHDRTGKFYAFDDTEGQYKSMSLLPASSMGFMTAGMTTQVYKLPQTPYFQAFEALSNMDIALNFLVLEMAFVYEPKHFENNDFYIKSEVTCGSNICIRYSYNDPEYEGSYIQFDSRGRLRELYIYSTNTQFKDDDRNPSGRFIFSYKPVAVELPDAIEQSMIPGPLGKILPLEKGLEPWKHNKKDEEKN